MENPAVGEFLDGERLVESSRPVARANVSWWTGAGFLVVMLISTLVGGQTPAARAVVSLVWGVAILVLMSAMSAISFYTVKRYRADQRRVEQVGELVQLRRWADAALAVNQYLSQPARTQAFRVQGLVYLSYVLARLHRFEEALKVQNLLLEEGILDESSTATLKISRAMSMLREDHLFDADRAISELRRSVAGGSAGVALVEIYRDVKTGHPEEAVEMFEKKREILRDQLGHRIGDVYALVARAYDLLGREGEAGAAFHDATLLSPVGELFRRYPEVEKLKGKYQPAGAPAEAA
jgi:tetratricopeptide (TPR) repeat protein